MPDALDMAIDTARAKARQQHLAELRRLSPPPHCSVGIVSDYIARQPNTAQRRAALDAATELWPGLRAVLEREVTWTFQRLRAAKQQQRGEK